MDPTARGSPETTHINPALRNVQFTNHPYRSMIYSNGNEWHHVKAKSGGVSSNIEILLYTQNEHNTTLLELKCV